jgi:hypothetical protein
MISADQELFHELKLQKAKRSVVEIAIARLALLATAIVLSLSLSSASSSFLFPSPFLVPAFFSSLSIHLPDFSEEDLIQKRACLTRR